MKTTQPYEDDMSTSETETGEGEKPAAFLGDPVAWRMRQRQGTSRYYDKDHVFDWTFAPRRYVMDDDAVCEHEPLYSKATVDRLRSEVSRLTAQVEALMLTAGSALNPDVSDSEIEEALKQEGIFVWGPDGERFCRMFSKVMALREAALNGGGNG